MASNVRGYQTAANQHYEKWKALKEELQPYLDDPTQVPK